MAGISSGMSILPSTWVQVLDQVQQALEAALLKAAERQAAPVLAVEPDAPYRDCIAQEQLSRLHARRQDWQDSMQRVDTAAREAEQNTEPAEDALKSWLASLQGKQQSLVNWTASAV
jgi:hypothetical protein